ncbi:MAG: rhodanese-related sulfurtransferase [Proteobacteria bacterium]|nr:rhodanese-related sulfurtransferase [Pseudomonadota bacterium]
MARFLVATFYQFTPLLDIEALRDALTSKCREEDIRGTILLAPEGINGTLCGLEDGLRNVLTYLRSDLRLAALNHKESWAEKPPFIRLKIRLKQEIVTLGVPDVAPATATGVHVKPSDWNGLINEPDVVLIDTRNIYETDLGTFQGSIDPRIESFGEFPQWIAQAEGLSADSRIAMFCTGGIRCEKASAYLLQQGFSDVYQLEGGILKYLEEIPIEESLWAGECYVFDDRVSVDHNLAPGRYELCRGCGTALAVEDKQDPLYIEGVACAHCHGRTTDEKKAGFAERQKQVRLAKGRNQSHFTSPKSKRKHPDQE